MIGSKEWEGGGECLKCRRHGYCKKQCKANKKLVNDHLMKAFRRQLEEKMAQAKEEQKEQEETT